MQNFNGLLWSFAVDLHERSWVEKKRLPNEAIPMTVDLHERSWVENQNNNNNKRMEEVDLHERSWVEKFTRLPYILF